jgi:N4-gp56 family major capsid protein
MAIQTTSNPSDFAYRRQEYLARVAWPELEFQLRMYQFAQKETIPAKGFKAARFYRLRKARRRTGSVGPTNLTEGTMTARGSTVTTGYVDCYAIQRGDDFSLSDIVVATDILPTLKNNMSVIMKDAALDLDGILMAAIMGNASTLVLANALGLGAAQTTLYGSNNTYGVAQAPYFERFCGVANTGVSSTDFATHAALPAASAKFTRVENLKAMTQLRANDVEPADGMAYPAVLSPLQMFDMRQDPTLVAAMTHRDTSKLYKYEKVELDGAAFIETTAPWIEAAGGYGTFNAAGNINTILYMGKDALGAIKLSNNIAGGDPGAIKIDVLDKADKSDIYNQTIVGVWKTFFGAIMKLTSDASDVPHVCALRCQTTYK